MLTHTVPWIPPPSGVMRRCAGPDNCTQGYCFNGLNDDEPQRIESCKAAEQLGWRRTNSGWICPTCAAKL